MTNPKHQILSDDNSIFNEYSSLQHFNPDHGRYVVINWCIGNTCNYKCSYCPENLHDASTPWPDLETVVTFCQKVMNHYKDRKLYFEFTGGEVTLWKDLPLLLDFLKTKGCRVGIISNGSRSEKFWQGLIDKIDHVCLSFHPESGREDHFFKIAELCSQKIRTHINFMMHQDHFSRCLALAYKVKDLENVSIAIQPLLHDLSGKIFPYTEAQKKIIATQNNFLDKQIKYTKLYESFRGAMQMVTPGGQRVTLSPQRFISSQNNKWEGWSCSAGLEQLVVDLNGEVFRGWCLVGGALGKVTDEKIAFPTQTVVCNKSHCHCNLDIMTTKYKYQSEIIKPIKKQSQPEMIGQTKKKSLISWMLNR